MKPVQTAVQASDPIMRAGVTALLEGARNIELLAEGDRVAPDVLVLAERCIAGRHVEAIRRCRTGTAGKPGARSVIVTDRIDEKDVLSAVQIGVMSILPTACATAAVLKPAVVGAANGSLALLPRRLQAALLRQLRELRNDVLEPHGLTFSGIELRELDAIRLVAEGYGTGEIASKLSCSEGTVKSVLYGVMERLRLSSRPHAVAYAMKTGALA